VCVCGGGGGYNVMLYFSFVMFYFYIWSCRGPNRADSRRNPSSIHIGKTKADYTPRKANRQYLIIVYGHWVGQRKSEITLGIEDVILRKQRQTWIPSILSRSNRIKLKTAPANRSKSRPRYFISHVPISPKLHAIRKLPDYIWDSLCFAPIVEIVSLSFCANPSL